MKSDLLYRMVARLRSVPFVGIFFDMSFVHYAWTGIFISVLNVFLLWFFIDKLHMWTIVASTLVVGATFLLRYVLFKFFDVL